MNSFNVYQPGRTLYYEGNKEGRPADLTEMEPPFGVRISNGVVRKQVVKKKWADGTRFYFMFDTLSTERRYGTCLELATHLNCREGMVKKKAKIGTLYRERFYIEEIGIEEFIKESGRAYREEVRYIGE